MTVSMDADSQRSILCGCCRFGSKKRRNNEINEFRLFQPSTSSVTALNLNETIPQIVISTPSSSAEFLLAKSSGLDTGRSEIFSTARTSRVDDTHQYKSMTQLVQSIREEAGFEDTPRPSASEGVTVSELRIEGLPEIASNNREAPLPSPSNLFYSSNDSSQNQSISIPIDSPSTVAQQQRYRSRINRKLGDLTVDIYDTFWRVYYVIIAAVALILERLLPV